MAIDFQTLEAIKAKNPSDLTVEDLAVFGIQNPPLRKNGKIDLGLANRLQSSLGFIIEAIKVANDPTKNLRTVETLGVDRINKFSQKLAGEVQKLGGDPSAFLSSQPIQESLENAALRLGGQPFTPVENVGPAKVIPKTTGRLTPKGTLTPEKVSADPEPIPFEEAPEITREYLLEKSNSNIPREEAEAEAKRVIDKYNITTITDPKTGAPVDPLQYFADWGQMRGGLNRIEQQATNLIRSAGGDPDALAEQSAKRVEQQANQLSREQASQVLDRILETNKLGISNPEDRESWVNYISKNGVEKAIELVEKNMGEDFEFGLSPKYAQGERVTYDTAKELADAMFAAAGSQKTGFYDNGASADDVYTSWVKGNQYRPIEESIALWNSRNTPIDLSGVLSDLQAKESERQRSVQTQNLEQFDKQLDFILSNGAKQQPFESDVPEIPIEFAVPQVPVGSQAPVEPFYPELNTFQPQQPGFQSPTARPLIAEPGFQSPTARPLITEPGFQAPAARPLVTEPVRPALDQAMQFIESGETFSPTGVQPMQYLSPYDLGGTFQMQPQAQPYFEAPIATQPMGQTLGNEPVSYGDVVGLINELNASGVPTAPIPTAPIPTAPIPTAPVTAPVIAPVATAPVTMKEGGDVSGIKAAAQQLAAMGRNGDTMLAHITPQEAGILKALGGSGTINPKTGLREYFAEWLLAGLMGVSTIATINEQKKQRQAMEAAQRRQEQQRMQQIARAKESYDRSGLQNIPLVSGPVRTQEDVKFDPSMGGVRPGEGVPEIPVPESGGIAALQPAPTAPAMTDDERRRRAMGIAGGGVVALAGGGMTYMEAGGTTGPTGTPRDVTGTGDGMSDSVPATIEGVQEARLADGEFVIPADVVADIGNGSSDAGSKKLYDMMSRIREARHGTTEQPPEINAEKFMPA